MRSLRQVNGIGSICAPNLVSIEWCGTPIAGINEDFAVFATFGMQFLLATGETVVLPMKRISKSPLTPQTRMRIALIIVAVLAISFLATSVLLIERAQRARQIEVGRLSAASRTLSQSLDLGVAAARSLLIGLSTSPSLKSGLLEEFYYQLRETQIPPGTWLVLSDTEKLLLQTLLPYGSPLPKLSEFPPSPNFLKSLEEKGMTVTGRYKSLVREELFAVTVNVKVPSADGRMKYFLTTVLSDPWFGAVLSEQQNTAGFSLSVFDNRHQGIVARDNGETRADPPMPEALEKDLSLTDTAALMSSLTEGTWSDGTPVLIAHTRSDVTEWTSVAAVSLVELDGPMRETLSQLVFAGLAVALAGAFAIGYMKKEVEVPLTRLQSSVFEANQAVGTLTERLLHVQEEEHQRIAAELHDSTAQHLVGALLSLMSLGPKLVGNKDAETAVGDAKISIEHALKELRTFSYLLHPRELDRGLSIALEEFVRGFAQRAGLVADIEVNQAVNLLSTDLQHSLLRITQAALLNVHQHARATRVLIKLDLTPIDVCLIIADEGEANIEYTAFGKAGVGIPSMRQRLLPFGGTLDVSRSAVGMVVKVVVPTRVQGDSGLLLTKTAE